MPISELTRKYGLGNSTIYNWRAKYGGMEASDLKELKHLKEENRRLKDLYAKISLNLTRSINRCYLSNCYQKLFFDIFIF